MKSLNPFRIKKISADKRRFELIYRNDLDFRVVLKLYYFAIVFDTLFVR